VTELFADRDRYGSFAKFPLVEATLNGMQDLVRRKLEESGLPWSQFVFGDGDRLITAEEIGNIERKILDSGHRFAWSSNQSVRDRPDIYARDNVGEDEANFSFEHPEAEVGDADDQGRAQKGSGDNVVQRTENVRGTALYVRTSEKVLDLMRNGVPDNVIAIIDDAGGTLTAPILERFVGVICAGGTIRSHLGILTREYGIPCLMNAKLCGIRNGDEVEIEASAPSPSLEDYQAQTKSRARIWKFA